MQASALKASLLAGGSRAPARAHSLFSHSGAATLLLPLLFNQGCGSFPFAFIFSCSLPRLSPPFPSIFASLLPHQLSRARAALTPGPVSPPSEKVSEFGRQALSRDVSNVLTKEQRHFTQGSVRILCLRLCRVKRQFAPTGQKLVLQPAPISSLWYVPGLQSHGRLCYYPTDTTESSQVHDLAPLAWMVEEPQEFDAGGAEDARAAHCVAGRCELFKPSQWMSEGREARGPPP